MDISQLFGYMAEEGYFNGTSYRIVSCSYGDERIVLPVTPWKYQAQLGQNNKIVEILDFGEMLVFGNTKLHRLKFSCFLPAIEHNYPFVVGDKRTPQEFLEILSRWKTGQCPVHVIITDSPVNENFAIMNLDFREKDGTRDIDYDLDLVEYRDWNVPESDYTRAVSSITGLRERPGIRSSSGLASYLENNARDIADIVKALGGGSTDIYSAAGSLSGIGSGTAIAGITKGKINPVSAAGSAAIMLGNAVGSKTISSAGTLAASTGQYMAMGVPAPVAAGLAVVTNPKAALKTVTGTVKNAWKVATTPVKWVGDAVKHVCFITTAVCRSFGKPDDCEELTAFRSFRDNWLALQPDGQRLINEYYVMAPEIVRKIDECADSAEIYRGIWYEYLEPCYELIQRGEYLACKRKYVEMVRQLQHRFR